LEGVRRDPGGALERESEGPVAELAREWLRLGAAEASASEEELRPEPLPYHTWGEASLDAARLQIETALRLPVAAGGALMAHAHVGLGLAVAVFVDATTIRIVPVPATMRVLGDWNWWPGSRKNTFGNKTQRSSRTLRRGRSGWRCSARESIDPDSRGFSDNA